MVFYCGELSLLRVSEREEDNENNSGASNGRGPRCAGWMQDYIDDVSKFGRKSEVKVFTLAGGIKGWVKDFEGALVDGFEEKYWEQFK